MDARFVSQDVGQRVATGPNVDGLGCGGWRGGGGVYRALRTCLGFRPDCFIAFIMGVFVTQLAG